MYYVYILKSLKKDNGFLYIGFTSNLKKRFAEHTAGLTSTTRRMLPVQLVYYEAYKSRTDAMQREKMLKQYGAALGHLRKRISKSITECS